MKITCLLAKIDARSRQVVTNAFRAAFPEGELIAVEGLEEASRTRPAGGIELLILANAEGASVARAAALNDDAGLRRWGVISIGKNVLPDSLHSLALADLSEERVAATLRSAAAFHELTRQNDQLKGDLLTLATRGTHDLRSPLGAIINTAEMLKEIVAEHDATSAALARPLFDSVDDLGKLIGRLSKLGKATVSLPAKQPVAMEEVIWAVLQRYERLILKKRARVINPEVWPEIEGVGAWLEVIWGNLVENSLQHGRDGLQIELGWNPQDQAIRFWANDNGEGIPAEKVPNLFQPFNLLHRLDSRKGLGLSIVRRLVELQGGQCGYAPLPLGGSSFHFTVPARRNPLAESHASSSHKASLRLRETEA
jgi:signal transduction histidine kinase